MADETLYGTKGYTSIIRAIDPSINIDYYIIQRTLAVGTDTAVAGDIVTNHTETQGLIDLAVDTDTQTGPLGVILGPTVPGAQYDLDDAIADDTMVNVLLPTDGRTQIAVVCGSSAGPVAWNEGDFVRVSNVAGECEKFVYTDGADSTDSLFLVIGQIAQVYAGSATSDRVIQIYY
jgi:hypothetical protein